MSKTKVAPFYLGHGVVTDDHAVTHCLSVCPSVSSSVRLSRASDLARDSIILYA